MDRLRSWMLLAVVLAGVLPALCHAAERETGTLGEGRPWQTPYYVHDTEVPGPTVLVVGGMHGNEPAGYRAADQIRHWPVVRGKLVVVPAANVLGLKQNTRFVPDAPPAVRDLNRDFPGDEHATGSAKGEIAAALWAFVLDTEPDWIFDLHEGFAFNVSHEPPEGEKKSVGSSVIHADDEQTTALARRIQTAANATVTDPDRRFTRLDRGPVSTGIVSATTRRLGCRGMILETTFNRQRLSVRVHQHRTMMNVALRELGMIDRDCVDLVVPTERDGRLAVGLFDGEGSSERGVANVTRVLDSAKDVYVAHLRPADVHSEALARFDVVIFSGGSGSQQAESIGRSGAKAVRRFVRRGGGYVGICAGAFLCSAHYDWSLDLIDTRVFTGSRTIEGVGRKQMWYRGGWADVRMEMTDAGRQVFEQTPEFVDVRYHNGPIVSPKGHPGLEPYEVLAYFRTETSRYPPQKGTMVDTPAIVTGRFGDGRVISISPHPEATNGLDSMIDSALRAVAPSANPVVCGPAD